MSPDEILNHEEIELNMKRLPGWHYDRQALHATLKCSEAQHAIDLFAQVAQLAQSANHHPDVDWRYNKLIITLTSHDAGGQVTQRDVALAQMISAAASRAHAVVS